MDPAPPGTELAPTKPKAPAFSKNSTPSEAQRQAIDLLEAIPADTLQGRRKLLLDAARSLIAYVEKAGIRTGWVPTERARRVLPPSLGGS